MNCSTAAYSISSAKPPWMRRDRAIISAPLSSTASAAMPTHNAR
jgi:hypothetical protein